MKSDSRLLTGGNEQYRPCVFFFFLMPQLFWSECLGKQIRFGLIRAAQWPAMTETDGFEVFNFLNNKVVNGWGFDLYIPCGLQSSGTDLAWISRESNMNSKTICGTYSFFFFFESQYVYITCVAYNDLDTEHFCSLGQGILNELRLMFCFLFFLYVNYAIGFGISANSLCSRKWTEIEQCHVTPNPLFYIMSKC